MSQYRPASDGLPARIVRPWAKDKLHYLQRYVHAFTTSMHGKWDRLVYIDLFSGPGISIIEDTDEEIEGSPIIALKAPFPFTELFFNDLSKTAADALAARVGARPDVIVTNLDCNEAANEASERLYGGHRDSRTLGLAFIDPTAFQIGLDAIALLTKGRRLDVLLTVMTGYMRRFITQRSYAEPMTQFFGSQDWQRMVDETDEGERITSRKLLDHYESRLRAIGYTSFDDEIRIANTREALIYHLVFASKHPFPKSLFKSISRKGPTGQTRLDL